MVFNKICFLLLHVDTHVPWTIYWKTALFWMVLVLSLKTVWLYLKGVISGLLVYSIGHCVCPFANTILFWFVPSVVNRNGESSSLFLCILHILWHPNPQEHFKTFVNLMKDLLVLFNVEHAGRFAPISPKLSNFHKRLFQQENIKCFLLHKWFLILLTGSCYSGEE